MVAFSSDNTGQIIGSVPDVEVTGYPLKLERFAYLLQRGSLGSAGILPAVDWRRCPQAGEDAGALRVGLSHLKRVAR